MNESNQSPALFEQTGPLVQGDAAATARAVQEVQAALIIAQRFPRDEIKAKAKILKACERPELAEVAEYEYTRGNTKITGPTIDLLRAIANRWGNLRFGWAEVDRQNGQSSIRTFAWDMQTNGQAERTFTVKHWRDTREGGYLLTDERDIYELLANSAARRVRACLEEVIDADIVTAAVDQCRRTLVQGAGKVPLRDQCVQMLNAFAEFGVTQEEIEKRIGNKLAGVSPNQLASLRRVFKSLKDGIGTKEDYFKPEMAKPEFDTPATADKPAAQPENEPVNALKALRGLCKESKVKEGLLLEYLGSSGASDGSVASIDELFMASSQVVEALVKQWPDVLVKFKEWENATHRSNR